MKRLKALIILITCLGGLSACKEKKPDNPMLPLFAMFAGGTGNSEDLNYLRYYVGDIPRQAKAGESLTFTVNVSGEGASVSEKVYLSRNSSIDTNDFHIGDIAVTKSSGDYSLTLPCNTPYGYYYLGLGENQSVSSRSILISASTPCLPVFYEIRTISPTGISGGDFEFSVYVIGGGDKPVTQSVYLGSASTTYFNRQMGTIVVQPTPGVQVFTLTLPPDVWGDYYIHLGSSTRKSSNSVNITIPPPTPITVTGKVAFEKIGIDPGEKKLDLNSVSLKPARAVPVRLLNVKGQIISETKSNELGEYTLSGNVSSQYRIQMVSHMSRTTSPAYDFKVKYTRTAHPFIVESENADVSCGHTCEMDLLALDSNRGNGPFAILDLIRDIQNRIYSIKPDTVFPPLRIIWNPSSVTGTFYLKDTRYCETTVPDCIYIYGDRNYDSDEFDSHVVAHEFVHYLEENLSRSDSIGGQHVKGDLLDSRVSYSEGLGNALSAIFLDDPLYIDTNSAGGFDMNMETGTHTLKGFYSEASVQSVLWDLYDGANEPGDSLSYSLSDVLNVVMGMKDSVEVLNLHEFIRTLRIQNPGNDAAIDDILALESIAATKGAESPVVAGVSSGFVADGYPNVSCDGNDSLYAYNPVEQNVVGEGRIGPFTYRNNQWCGAVSRGVNKLFGTRFLRVTPDQSGIMFIRTEEPTRDYDRHLDVYIHQSGVELRKCTHKDSELCSVAVQGGETYIVELRLYDECLFKSDCRSKNEIDYEYTLNIDLPRVYSAGTVYPCPDCRYTFLTSEKVRGDFGGPAAADALCMRNIPAGLENTGEYRALVVDRDTRVALLSERKDWVLDPGTSYYREDGTTLIGVTNSDAYFTFPLLNSPAPVFEQYWTGLDYRYEWTTDTSIGASCYHWKELNSTGSSGYAYDRGYDAFGSSSPNCGDKKSLLCVQK